MNLPGKDGFATTRWTMVIAASQRGSDPGEDALAELCQSYWFPLYAYVRRRGYSKEDAEDLTQSFFSNLLDREMLANLDGEKGRFRAFLLAALKNFLANEWDRANRRKRGGSIPHLPLDWNNADQRFELADRTIGTLDRMFDREWALALLERVILTLQEEFTRAGKAAEFDSLREFLTLERADISPQTMDGALRVRIHRLRKRYRELLKREVAHTLRDPSMVEEELRVLLGAFAEE